MTHKKMKITVECEGQVTQVYEAKGLAAALLNDAGEDTHNVSLLICGNMSAQDLYHLSEAVENELTDAVNAAAVNSSPIPKLLKSLLGGRHESKR